MAKAGRGSDQFMVRLPPGMREQIKYSADENGRSMNSEILDVLREHFFEPPGFEELIEELDFSLASLIQIKDDLPPDQLAHTRKFQNVLGRIEATNEQLERLNEKVLVNRVVRLSAATIEEIGKLRDAYDLPDVPTSDLVNGLVRDAVQKVLDGEAPLRVWIGEGVHERAVTFQEPVEPRKSDKAD